MPHRVGAPADGPGAPGPSRKTTRLPLAVAGMALAAAGSDLPAVAQESAVAVGDEVRVTMASGARRVGTLTFLGDADLGMMLSAGHEVTVPYDDVRGLERGTSRSNAGRGALIGAAVGGGLGLLGGLVVGIGLCDGSCQGDVVAFVPTGILVGGGVGALLGAAIGQNSRGPTRWEPVDPLPWASGFGPGLGLISTPRGGALFLGVRIPR